MSSLMKIDYEKMAADYDNGLFTRLRSFGPAADFLETWVPDADDIKSICNMLDAAAVAGRRDMAIFIGRQTAESIDQGRLLKAAGDFGAVHMEPDGEGLLLTVSAVRRCADKEKTGFRKTGGYVKKAETFSKVRDISAGREIKRADHIGAHYRKAVEAAGRDLRFEGFLSGRKGYVIAEGEHGGARLMLLVDRDDHSISRASHNGASTAIEKALLDRLCALIEGKPIQEAGDHGVIRLEFDLRDKSMERPLAGIVMADAADAAFLLPLKLVRDALEDYRRKTGYVSTDNTYDPGPSEEWKDMPDDERRRRLNDAIARIAEENNFPAEDVRVTAIEHHVRVVIRFNGALEHADKQRCLMILETGIKDMVDGRLELFQEEIRDNNRLRRLSGERTAP